jgi:hypothetical protein
VTSSPLAVAATEAIGGVVGAVYAGDRRFG